MNKQKEFDEVSKDIDIEKRILDKASKEALFKSCPPHI
jgi:hypothetical protein